MNSGISMQGATISGGAFEEGGPNTVRLSKSPAETGHYLMYSDADDTLKWVSDDGNTVFTPFASKTFQFENEDSRIGIIVDGKGYSIPVRDLATMHKQWKSGDLGRIIVHQEGYYMTTQIWSVSGVVSIIFISMLGAWILRKFSFRGTVRWFIRLVYKPAKEKVAEAEAVWKEEKSKGE